MKELPESGKRAIQLKNSMQKNLDNIGIVGGGIAGLTLGCTLLQDGIPAIIFEQSSEVSSYGAGISLSKNALCLLERLNVLDNLQDRSFTHSKVEVQGPVEAICEFSSPFGWLAMRRQELINCLLETYLSLGGEILYDHSLKTFNQVTREITFENDAQYTVNHLAACDGIRSSIRDTFFTINQKPKYSGYSAWRGVGKSELKCVHFVLGPNSHIVNYPLNKEGDVSFVGVLREPNEFDESWRKEGSYQDFLDDFSIYDPSIFPILDDSTKLYKWGIYTRPPLKSMTVKNITLLGDAAHPMVPFIGQGGCMAIEDAYAFGILCKITNCDFAKAQKTYDSIRSKRTKKIQRRSMMQAAIYHMTNPLLVAARNALMRYTNIPANNLNSIHKYDVEDAIKVHKFMAENPSGTTSYFN
jgi:salicylate hydroxylase